MCNWTDDKKQIRVRKKGNADVLVSMFTQFKTGKTSSPSESTAQDNITLNDDYAALKARIWREIMYSFLTFSSLLEILDKNEGCGGFR